MTNVQATLGAAASTAKRAAMVRGGETFSCQVHDECASPLYDHMWALGPRATRSYYSGILLVTIIITGGHS